MNKIGIMLLLVLSAYACKENKKREQTVLVDIKKQCPVEDFFEDYHTVTLQTLDENLISDIDKIQIKDSLIYVLDKKQYTVHIFDKNGFFINKIYRFGEGPMEYIDIADFSVEDSTVYILSRISRKLNVYTNEGEFIKSYPLKEWYDFFHKDNGDNIFLYSNYSNNTLYNIVKLNLIENTVLRKFSPFSKNQSFGFSETPFNVSANGDVFITQQYDYHIYQLNEDTLHTVCKLDFNTVDKIPDNFEKIGFVDVYQSLADKSVVKRITHVTRHDDNFFILYVLDYVKHISKINITTNESCTSKLEFIDRFPFVFAEPLTFYGDYITGYLAASSVLIFDDKFKSDKNENGYLDAEDNPVLFFHKIK